MEAIANLFIYLEVEGQDINFELLNDLFSDTDCFWASKGDQYIDDNGQVKYREDDYWSSAYIIKQNDSESLSEILDKYLDCYISNNKLKNEIKNQNVKIWLSIYPEKEQYSLELSSEIMKKLVDWNLGFGATILHLQEFYKGKF